MFLGEQVVMYHSTLTTYLEVLQDCGFLLNRVAEPMPPASMVDTVPGMRDEMRRPMMLIVAAEKR